MYHLELNDEQVRVVIRALDCFTRINMGQIEEVGGVLSEGPYATEQIEKVRLLCKDIKVAIGFSENSSYGIYGPKVPKPGKVAYDIQCVIRQVVARIENHGSYSVWCRDPLHCELTVPLAVCRHE